MRDDARAILNAGRAWKVAQSAWIVTERLEAKFGMAGQLMSETAQRATQDAEDAIDAALAAGAGCAALLLQGIPAAAIASGLSRIKGD